jgi:hypothetical protein
MKKFMIVLSIIVVLGVSLVGAETVTNKNNVNYSDEVWPRSTTEL